MSKKPTGLQLTPQEFRLLNKCMTCGKMTDIQPETKCKECQDRKLKQCEMCEIVLHEGIFKFYSYDTKKYNRDIDIDFKVSKKIVTEYVVEEFYESLKSEIFCNRCIDWKKRMKDICWLCDNDFNNSRENYKLNGNMCETCSVQFQDVKTNECQNN